MELRAPDLSAQTSSAIERAIRAPADKPIEMQGLVTSDLPAAADYPYGWIFDLTAGVPKFSNGTIWLTFSGAVITNTPAGNISATTVQAAINELDTEKGGLSLANTWSGLNTYSGGARMTGGSPPASGSGLELRYGGGIGFVTANNRSSSTLLEMRFEADPYRFYVSGSNQALILNSTNGAYFPTAGTTSSPPNAYLDAGSLNNLLRSTYTFGSAAQKNTGTSGNNVPLLDGINTWSGTATYSFTNGNIQIIDTGTGAMVGISGSAGRIGELTFNEAGVANRWAVGVKPGDSTLYWCSTNTISGSTVRIAFSSGGAISIAGNQVITGRRTGWAADTGTDKRTSTTTYSATANASYNQAQIQSLMDAVRDVSRAMKSLKDDLISHGLIGT